MFKLFKRNKKEPKKCSKCGVGVPAMAHIVPWCDACIINFATTKIFQQVLSKPAPAKPLVTNQAINGLKMPPFPIAPPAPPSTPMNYDTNVDVACRHCKYRRNDICKRYPGGYTIENPDTDWCGEYEFR